MEFRYIPIFLNVILCIYSQRPLVTVATVKVTAHAWTVTTTGFWSFVDVSIVELVCLQGRIQEFRIRAANPLEGSENIQIFQNLPKSV